MSNKVASQVTSSHTDEYACQFLHEMDERRKEGRRHSSGHMLLFCESLTCFTTHFLF